MEHCWYSNNIINSSTGQIAMSGDPQHRKVRNIFAAPESQGTKEGCGGVDDLDLYLACPIGSVMIQYNAAITRCVFEGDNQEFDPITSASDGANTVKGIAGLALADGLPGTPGKRNGQERGWGVQFVTVPSGQLSNCFFVNKNDPLNNGAFLQISTVDTNNVGTNPNNVGAFVISENSVLNWNQGEFADTTPAQIWSSSA